MTPDLSIIVPVHNERNNVGILAAQTAKALGSELKWEALWMNDASDDGSAEALERIAANDPRHRVIHLDSRKKQSGALAEGYRLANAPIFATMDGDGQNDPSDIPRLLAYLLATNCDMVNGWRYVWLRKDPFKRKLVSFGGNVFLRFALNEKLHDAGCGLRVFRRGCVADLSFYSKLQGGHRFLPSVSRLNRHRRMAEMRVNHRDRFSGGSNYGTLNRKDEFLHDVNLIWNEMGKPLPIPSVSWRPRNDRRRPPLN
jgi:dolichol-phosphate mannosyltransferase